MLDFDDIVFQIKDFFSERQKPLVISGILGILFVMAALIVAFQGFGASEKKGMSEPEPLVMDQDLMLPDGISVPSTYAVSRQKKEKWTQEECEEWFTLPEKSALENLEQANKRLTDEITGAVQ